MPRYEESVHKSPVPVGIQHLAHQYILKNFSENNAYAILLACDSIPPVNKIPECLAPSAYQYTGTSSMTDNQDISRVVENGLCHSCGACSGTCPEDAIRFEETISGFLFPVVDPEKCTSCGSCLAVCPGESLGDAMVERLPEDPFTGHAIRSFIGRSLDERVYSNSQSGGVASELLIHALLSKDISGAVVVTMNPGTNPRPEAYIASSEEEIVAAQKSKYVPVPLLDVLGQLDHFPGAVAIVGLSCHMHGLVKTLEQFPGLAEKVKYRIGLVCDRSLSCVSIDYLSMKAGFEDGEEKDLIFRDKSCGGYPGDVRVSSADGRSVILGDGDRRRIKPYLTPQRCHLCFDKMNVFSDVTIGDPHGISSADRKNGESVCIARCRAGLALVESTIGSGRVTLREIPYSEIVQGQKIDRKRAAWRAFCEEWQSLGKLLPDYFPSIRKHADSVAGYPHYNVENALRLSSFGDRGELLAWIKENDRKDLLLNTIRSVYTYPMLAARKLVSILKRSEKP